jgi:hypothetical protein
LLSWRRYRTIADYQPTYRSLTHVPRSEVRSLKSFGMRLREESMRAACWEASQSISGYQEETAGDDGVRGESAWALAPMHYLRSAHGTHGDDALQILPWPGAGPQGIQPRSPGPHRTPATTPRLPVPGWHVQRSRIETSPRVEIRRCAIEVAATGGRLTHHKRGVWLSARTITATQTLRARLQSCRKTPPKIRARASALARFS